MGVFCWHIVCLVVMGFWLLSIVLNTVFCWHIFCLVVMDFWYFSVVLNTVHVLQFVSYILPITCSMQDGTKSH